eukprot:Pompholyxophrys_sp_v1_NODE_173_length_1350_cov_3.789189.p2 type:complete len:108 gc:universal NODE_173_length_1350_cov_3.789189:1348-1025(-)
MEICAHIYMQTSGSKKKIIINKNVNYSQIKKIKKFNQDPPPLRSHQNLCAHQSNQMLYNHTLKISKQNFFLKIQPAPSARVHVLFPFFRHTVLGIFFLSIQKLFRLD